MCKDLKENIDIMKREMEVIRKNQMKLPDWKNTILKMKNYWMGLKADQRWQKKRLLNLKMEQGKLCKMKHRRILQKGTEHQGAVGQLRAALHVVVRALEGEQWDGMKQKVFEEWPQIFQLEN